MMMKYEMADLGLLHHFLGMGVVQTRSSIFIHQKKYASSLLNKFGLNECNTVTTPLAATEKLTKDDGNGATSEGQYRSIVGSLLYLIATRPNIMYASSLLARFMHCPTSKHYGTAKRVLRYIKGTLDYGLEYVKGKNTMLIGFCDSDWEDQLKTCDNTSAIAITKNPVIHQKTKHIDRRYHFIEDALQEGIIDLVYCPIKEQLADIFTKPLAKYQFNYLRSMLGVKSAQDLKESVEL
ncbi:hypothetical protein L3X38_010350 [Prunus dulcis]|uniref:Reverse transcriptase Ty1/copia-type domain-containing protein n=1 Tax=Prunus dulcis TaxID=3755 RepID=A0AAD4ZDY1_PRUDU|nr:hypothetical protein L3X38_010350 [Prunus dulcis]